MDYSLQNADLLMSDTLHLTDTAESKSSNKTEALAVHP